MKIIYAKESIDDLSDIYEYLVNKSETSARQVISTIHIVMSHLTTFPYMGHIVEDDIRILISTKYNYSIYYRVEENEEIVKVLNIVHSKRNFKIKKHVK